MNKILAAAAGGILIATSHVSLAHAADYNMVLSMQVTDPDSPIYQRPI